MPLPTVLHTKNVHTLCFPGNLNTNGSKTPTALINFHTNCEYNDRLSINKDVFSCGSLQNAML